MAIIVGGTTVTGTQTVLASVLTGTASVGTWAFLRNFSGGNIGTGGTTAGSGLKYAAANGQEASAASGTWRCMGIAYTGDETGTTVWLRTA